MLRFLGKRLVVDVKPNIFIGDPNVGRGDRIAEAWRLERGTEMVLRGFCDQEAPEVILILIAGLMMAMHSLFRQSFVYISLRNCSLK